MKKASYNRIVKTVTTAFDVRRWSDFDRMKSYTLYLVNSIRGLFVPAPRAPRQSFEQAMSEFKISEQSLRKKENSLLRLSIFMSVLGGLVMIYTLYLLTLYSWHAALLSLVVSMLSFVLSFRYHFWFFQIKKRKLGCTFQEWFKQGLLGEKK